MITEVEIYSGFLPELQLIKKDDPNKLWREKRSKHFTGSQIYRLMERPTPESLEAYKKYIEAKGDFYKNLPDNIVL